MRYTFLFLLVAGCTQYVPNETVIAEAKKCTDSGMDYWIADWGYVHCSKPEKAK